MKPVVCLRNGNFVKLFDAINAAHIYLQEVTEGSKNDEELWDAINFGIDDHKSWSYQEDIYDFRSTKEVQDARANRTTRKVNQV